MVITIPQPKCAEEYYSSCAMIDRHNRSRQQVLNIEKKFGTKSWDMRVNLSILSMIIVDTWCVYNEIMGEQNKDTEDVFYAKLAEQMIDNTLDTPHKTRRRSQPIRNVTEPSSTLDTVDGRVYWRAYHTNKEEINDERKIDKLYAARLVLRLCRG